MPSGATSDGGATFEGDRCPVCGVGRPRDLAYDAVLRELRT